jgi:hypothetical protein
MTKLDTGHRDKISATHFAFPKQRKEPLEDASHVRNAVARFDQVDSLTLSEPRRSQKGDATCYRTTMTERSRFRSLSFSEIVPD